MNYFPVYSIRGRAFVRYLLAEGVGSESFISHLFAIELTLPKRQDFDKRSSCNLFL